MVLPWWLTEMAEGRTLFFTRRSLYRAAEYSHNMVAAFPRASDPKQQGRSCNVFYNLALEVTLYYFHNILSFYFHNIPKVSPIHYGRGQPKDKNTERYGSLGTILEAVYHKSVDSFIVPRATLVIFPTRLEMWGWLCLAQLSWKRLRAHYVLWTLKSENKRFQWPWWLKQIGGLIYSFVLLLSNLDVSQCVFPRVLVLWSALPKIILQSDSEIHHLHGLMHGLMAWWLWEFLH